MSGKLSNYNIWIEYARQDFKTAQIVFKENIFNQVCFHSQQAIEKLLKAFLVKNNINPPRIHSIKELLKMCSQFKEANSLNEKALIIDTYYIPTRYPEALIGSLPEGMPDKDEAKEALQIAQDFFDFFLSDF